MNVENLVENFRQLIIAAWPQLQAIVGQVKDHPYFIDDWLQANWELMVESPFSHVHVSSEAGLFNLAIDEITFVLEVYELA